MPTSNVQNFRVGLVQLRCGPDPDENLARAVEQVQAASKRGAQVVCLPELFRTQYFCQREDASLFDLAEPIPGPTTEKISPDDPLYYEKYYFTPGDLGFKAFDTSFGRIGTLVCWDQWYPEGARLTALQGAQVLFYPTAIGWHPAEKSQYGTLQHDAWRTIQRAHAIANGVYVAVVNRVGHETGNIRGNETAGTGLEFWGRSFLCDPFGKVLAEASQDKEEILVGEIDVRTMEEIRRNWPFLRDRRIDSYGPITQRFLD